MPIPLFFRSLVIVGGFLTQFSSASADTLRATQDQPLRESSHSVDIRVNRGVATYKVKRTFSNLGSLHEEAQLQIHLPPNAAVRGLRIRGKTRWHAGKLMHVVSARSQYGRLTGRGPHWPRDPALLQWVAHDKAHLHLFPIAPQSTSTVEYTLSVPTEYKNGQYILYYPDSSDTKNLSIPVIRLYGNDAHSQLLFDGTPVASGEPCVATRLRDTADDSSTQSFNQSSTGKLSDMHVIKISAAPIALFTARLGNVDSIQGKNFQRLELDAAKELTKTPNNIFVVFVFDLSKSQTSKTVLAQIEIARAYLSHTPHARFQIVGYSRFASRLTKAFRPAHDFDALVNTLKAGTALKLMNGSNLDGGLKWGQELLRKKRGTKRIIVLSDQLLSPHWENSHSMAQLPKRTITHVVDASPLGLASSKRLNHNQLADLADASGGIMLRVSGAHTTNKKALDRVALQLVRPTQIDDFAINSTALAWESPDILRQGDGLRIMVAQKQSLSKVKIRGRLWSKPFQKTIHSSPRFNRASAAFVFSHDMHSDLSENEQFRLAMHARVLSPQTAFLAIEPGVRPSTAGLKRTLQEGIIGGVLGGVIGGVLGASTASDKPKDYWRNLFSKATAECVATHKPNRGWSLQIDVHMTYAEVVDVNLSEKSSFASCLEEKAWSLDLKKSFHHETRSSWRMSLAEGFHKTTPLTLPLNK